MTISSRTPGLLALLLCGGLACSGDGAGERADGPAPPPPTVALAEQQEGPSWRQWGGPNGEFKVSPAGLANTWGPQGPPLVWSRPLGPGYSAIVAHRGALFTMYRDRADEVVTALRAADGERLWEHRYAAPPREGNTTQFGKGPNATPLVLGDRVITLGYTGVLNCLELETGKRLWSHDLIEEFGGQVLDFGYSASPIGYRDHVVVLVGGQEQGAMVFDPSDGSVVWRGHPSTVSYATPIVVDVGGRDQLVYFSADAIIGIDSATGEFRWSHPCVNQYRNNATDAIWGEDGLLWVATQLDGGTRVLRLHPEAEATRVEEVWFDNKISIHFWNALRLDDHVYASIGSNASVLAGIDVTTGDVKWRQRGFKQINLVHAGDRTLFLDADGRLALARLSPDGVTVLAEAKIADGETWTVPTLLGTRLYVRDKRTIRAFELGADNPE